MGLKVERYTWDFIDSNMYLIETGNHVLVIDPIDNEQALKKCEGAETVTVLLTHEHFDHICGLNKLRGFCSIVIACEKCSERIQDSKTNMSAYAEALIQLGGIQSPKNWMPFACKCADITFTHKHEFQWMGHKVILFASPGHSEGSCCIMTEDVLFVGDSILRSHLMVKFPGSNKELYNSVTLPLLEKKLQKVKVIYPGHGDMMTQDLALRLLRDV